MAITGYVLFAYFDVPGVVIGASALSVAVIAEAIASRLMVAKTLSQLPPEVQKEEDKLTFKSIYKFYYPLALMSLLSLGIQPFVTFLVGQSRMAIESLAVLPVVTSFVFIFRAMGLSYQEVIIAKIGDDKSGYIPLQNFALLLGGILSLIIITIAFSPLAEIWFMGVSGLSEALSDFAILPLQIMAIIPALTVLICFQRSVLVSDKNTGPITMATAIEFIGIVIVMIVSIKIFSFVGAVAATTAFVLGRAAANVYLVPCVKKSK
jgi:hypothetical protein